jgi:hypothetical protein
MKCPFCGGTIEPGCFCDSCFASASEPPIAVMLLNPLGGNWWWYAGYSDLDWAQADMAKFTHRWGLTFKIVDTRPEVANV